MKTKYKKLNNDNEKIIENRIKNLEQTILSLIKVVELQSTQIKYIIKKVDANTSTEFDN